MPVNGHQREAQALSDYDVIVIGAGGAGLAAAVTAAEEGARVLIAEAADKVGGATWLSGGVFYAAGTRTQRQRGVVDDGPAAMFSYYMAINQCKIDAGMVHMLCVNAGPSLEWLMDLGVSFPPENLYAAGLDGVLRGHRASGRGAEIVGVLDRCVSASSTIDLVLRTRVKRCLPRRPNRAASVLIDGEWVDTHSIVITTGGFGAEPDMIARLLPQMAVYGDWIRYVGAPTNRGDGIAMAEEHGAVLSGLGRASALLTPNFSADFEPYTPGWLTFVDRRGNRFIDETLDYTVVPGAVGELPERECFAVFDEDARIAAKQHIPSPDAKKIYAYSSWSGETLLQMAQERRIFVGASIEDLAGTAGIHAPSLATTARLLNEDAERGADLHFLKPVSQLRPLRTPPFYAVRLRPAVIGTTHAGLRCDRDARVLGQDGRPIAGLFAAGETVGNVLGERYVGGGNAIANAITFGRIAGRCAAWEALAVSADASASRRNDV